MKKIFGKIELESGAMPPRWYLLVYREDYSLRYVCYPFYIAPAVIMFHILQNAFWNIWRDLVQCSSDMHKFLKNKEEK